jgi:hypothetical protein
MTPFPDEAFLALVPVQVLLSESGEGGNLILLRPKILSPRWSWLLKMIRNPVFRVKLDARGTAVWQACDSGRTVTEVIAKVSSAFPQEPDTTIRTALFLRELARGGFIALNQVDQSRTGGG